MPDLSIGSLLPDRHDKADLLALGSEFLAASDAKLRKVTRLIDSMPERGAADALLQPVRERLATLRPVRTLNRNRLLFTPFDRLLVPPTRWQPGTPTLPRSIVSPVIALLDGAGGPALPAPPSSTPTTRPNCPAMAARSGRRRPIFWSASGSGRNGTIPPGGRIRVFQSPIRQSPICPICCR
ncbi:hypothetical protein NFI95_12395 [Acetobacteraceae bacterium KSS8]|uniref:Transposase n=1 Tax=Endosaccharibacter trunci TaxID=2812733 RepID=A0ABT1WBN7_9PROT|nr:hypothetical protein [Acetobacteraceae bacterium KSS8]